MIIYNRECGAKLFSTKEEGNTINLVYFNKKEKNKIPSLEIGSFIIFRLKK